MNARYLIAALAVAAATASGVARADDADASQYVIKFQSQRSTAEVMAEAAKVPTTRSLEPAGSRVIAAPTSDVTVQAVRAEAIQALRLGKIPSGEMSF
jgi:hypothetical protein